MDKIRIKKVQFINIQSFKNQVIEGSDGMNVLRAPNQTGKSVLFKIIQILGSRSEVKRDQWVDYISKSEDSGIATVLFSDNSIAGVIIRKTGGPIYRYYPDFVKDPNHYLEDDKPFKEVITKLGLLVDSDGRVLNIINSKSINRFTDQSYTGPDLINQVVTNYELSKLIEDNLLAQARTKNNRTIIENEMNKSKIMMDSIGYKDTSSINDLLPLLENAIQVSDSLLYFGMYLDGITPNPVVHSDIETMLSLLDAIEFVSEVSKIKESVSGTEDIDSLESLLELVEEIEKVKYVEDTAKLDALGELLDIFVATSEIKEPRDANFEDISMLLDISEILIEFNGEMMEIFNSLEKTETLSSEVKELEAIISTLGKEVECPIYGRIVHADEICTPISN